MINYYHANKVFFDKRLFALTGSTACDSISLRFVDVLRLISQLINF